MTKKFTLALVEHQGQLYVFEKSSNATKTSWESLSIKGESSLSATEDKSWKFVLQEINDKLNLSSKLAEVWIYWFLEETQPEAMQHLQKLRDEFDINHWSLLHWQGLKELGLINEQEPHQSVIHWIAEQLTRLLVPKPQEPEQLEYQEDTQESIPKTDLITRLSKEKQQLQTEKKHLEQQVELQKKQLDYLKSSLENTAPLRLELETLVTYLPVLYKNFWGQIRPDAVAMLANSLHIPEVPSPRPEPDSGVLQVMRKRLQNMPKEQQDQLRQFCRQLPHSPQSRPEMAFFFEDDY